MVGFLKDLDITIFAWNGMPFTSCIGSKFSLNMIGYCSDEMNGRMEFFEVFPYNIGAFGAVRDFNIFDVVFLTFVDCAECTGLSSCIDQPTVVSNKVTGQSW